MLKESIMYYVLEDWTYQLVFKYISDFLAAVFLDFGIFLISI